MSVSAKREFPIRCGEKHVFRKRLAESLRHRLYPNTGLHPKQLAGALGKSTDTVFHWLRGENTAEGESIDSLINFFVSQGDHGFVTEVFPGVIPLVQRHHEAEVALQFVQSMKATFKQLEAVA